MVRVRDVGVVAVVSIGVGPGDEDGVVVPRGGGGGGGGRQEDRGGFEQLHRAFLIEGHLTPSDAEEGNNLCYFYQV